MSSLWNDRPVAALALVVAAIMPATVSAQWSLSAARTQSLVRWDSPCGSCGSAQANTPRTSTSVGIGYARSILPWLALEGDARFVTKGYTVTGPELELRYLEVPVLARLELPRRSARVTPFLVAGIAPAFKLECSLERWGCQQGSIGDRRIRPMDLSGVFGGGFELRVAEHAFDLEYRLSHGWADIDYEQTIMRNILVSSVGVTYRHLGKSGPPGEPLVAGGVIGASRTMGNTCGVVNQATGVSGELQFRRLAGQSWWAARLEGGGSYFPQEMTGFCTPVRNAFGGSDVRTMSGSATLGPGVVLEPLGSAVDFSPYVHAFAGGFAAYLDNASPGYGRVALGGAVGASAGVKLRRGARRFAVEVRYQSLAPVLGQRVNMLGLGIGPVP